MSGTELRAKAVEDLMFHCSKVSGPGAIGANPSKAEMAPDPSSPAQKIINNNNNKLKN